MADVIISMVTKIAEHLVDPIIRHAGYLFLLRKYDESLRNEKSQLESKLVSVKERVKVATSRTEKITEPVEKWLNEVKDILEEVQKLEQRVEEATKRCFHWSFRYSLAKQVARKTQQMVTLINECQFEPFSLPIELEGMHYFSSKDFVYLESTTSACSEILHAIKDDGKNTIGLYGMGGSGKTSLAKEVGKKIEELKLFDKVIMAVVSQPLNIKNIQDQISDQLGLKFDERSIQGRARRLSKRLRDERNLIILDDVWEVINLEDIGIPFKDNNGGCCVLLTTRLRRVCASMGCQSIIELSPLTNEEAWALFKLRANITNDSPNELKGVAKNIANECKGLPIAIVTVGSTLRGKRFSAWELALSRLKNSQPVHIDEGLRSPYACLKLSYDNLTNPTAKSLFLLCSMFPEDHDIDEEDLIRFGKGVLELSDTDDTMEEARREIYVAINILLDSCLLMPTYNVVLASLGRDYVKMHDLVRDVALWIAPKEDQAIMVSRQVAPRLLVENEVVKDIKTISLWDLEKNFNISGEFHCPTLKTLLLHFRSDFGFKESNISFGRMGALKVLVLIGDFSLSETRSESTWSLPQSIGSLRNLHTLCLRGIALGDLSFLGTLKRLEILDLSGSSFDELPIGIVDMKKLKLLDLLDSAIAKCPWEVIGRCLQLQELYFMLFDDASVCLENVSVPKLHRYVIFFSLNGEAVDQASAFGLLVGQTRASRCLCMAGYDGSALNSSMKDLIVGAELLYLDNCRWKWDDNELFYKAKYLVVGQCPETQFIVDIPDHHVYKEPLKLKSDWLTLVQLPELELIWKGPPQIVSLQRLEQVYISECPKLKTIFTPTIVTSLPELRELYVAECKEWEGILMISANSDSLPNLSASNNVCFPKLTKIGIKHCHKLKCLFSQSLASHCPSLTELKIQNCSQLERIVDGELEDRLLFSQMTWLTLQTLPKLTQIFGFEFDKVHHRIRDCPNLLVRRISIE